LTPRVIFGLPLRQTVGLARSLSRIAGLDRPAPDHLTLCRRQARIAEQIPYRASGQLPTLLVDSTGIKFRGDGAWLVCRHGVSRRRQWCKVHIAMDAGTDDVRAVAFTSGRRGDSPLLPSHETTSCSPHAIRAGRSGENGQNAMSEAGSRPN
jgi:hypothetical protein